MQDIDASWTISGVFLDALTRRDFDGMRACLDPDVRFRALVPHGLLEFTGSDETVGWFRELFADKATYDVLDASIGQIGTRMYMQWRLQTTSPNAPCRLAVVEQHAFATGGTRIETLDLLCSGFQERR